MSCFAEGLFLSRQKRFTPLSVIECLPFGQKLRWYRELSSFLWMEAFFYFIYVNVFSEFMKSETATGKLQCLYVNKESTYLFILIPCL